MGCTCRRKRERCCGTGYAWLESKPAPAFLSYLSVPESTQELDDELGDLTSEDEEDEDQSEAKAVYSESEDDRARKQPVPRAALPDDFHTWRKPKRTVQRESEGSESRDSAPQPAQRRQTTTLDELEEKGYTMKNDSDADEDAEESFDEVSASEDEGGMDLTGE